MTTIIDADTRALMASAIFAASYQRPQVGVADPNLPRNAVFLTDQLIAALGYATTLPSVQRVEPKHCWNDHCIRAYGHVGPCEQEA